MPATVRSCDATVDAGNARNTGDARNAGFRDRADADTNTRFNNTRFLRGG
jgi:hypothetical protein